MTNSNLSTGYEPNRDDDLLITSSTLHEAVLIRKNLNAVAVSDVALGKDYTYGEIHSQVLSVAYNLIEDSKLSNISKDAKLVAVLSEKGVNQAIATLAIMKTGKAYLPLNVDWPTDRLKSVLQEGQVATVLVSRKVYEQEGFKESFVNDYRLLVIEDLATDVQEGMHLKYTAWPEVAGDDVAYVIYTSGSTGKPKGVTISHQGALNTIIAVNKQYTVNENDSVLALSELSFDLSVYDIFGLLIVGGRVVFPDQERTKESEHWRAVVEEYQISIWNTVPQLSKLLHEEYEFNDLKNNTLRLFLLSGDKLPLSLPTQIASTFLSAIVVSLGGATEGSIWSIWFEITIIDPTWEAIPYGYAMPNQSMHVLDETGQAANVGEVGEICIGGEGVALNYWQDPQRTAESFSTHSQLGRIYLTGDLGIMNSAGYIEFVGRKDRQLKVRGYRVELGEIEAKLAMCSLVSACAVTTLDSLTNYKGNYDGKTLIAYYVSSTSSATEQDDIKAYLITQLQDYMVPEFYVATDALPLSANGKLDYKSLPVPTFSHSQVTEKPKTELEEHVAAIWSQVLGIPEQDINMTAEFTQLGGDSIDAIRLSSRIRQAFQCNLTVAEVFACNTLQKIAEQVQLNKLGKATLIQREEGRLNGEFALLPIQQWFFDKQFAFPEQWSQLFFIKTPQLDLEKLNLAVNELLTYHDAFSLCFRQKEAGEWAQCYDPTAHSTLDIKQHQVASTEEYIDQCRDEQCNFDLQHGPLFSVSYLTGFADGSARVAFLVHHLVVDTVSWRLLTEDLQQFYDGNTLAQKGSSYRQWISAVNQYAVQNQSHKMYWQQELTDFNEPFSDVKERSLQAYTASFSVSALDTTVLLKEANTIYNTEINDLLLSALAHTLADQFGNVNTAIMLEGHGREELDHSIDISRTMGWFTSLYPLKLSAHEKLSSTIKHTKELLRKIPDKGVGFGALHGYAHQLPSICFNYLGQLSKHSTTFLQDSDWHLTDENVVLLSNSNNDDGYHLVITGSVVDGIMCFTVESYVDQLLASQVAANIEQYLQEICHFAKAQSRSYLTVHDVDSVVSEQYLDELQQDNEITGVYLANSLQQGFIYHALSQGDTDTAYQVQTFWDYHCEIDPQQLKQAWLAVQTVYASLRTRFVWQEQLLQVVDKTSSLSWVHLDIKDLPAVQQDAYLSDLLDDDRQQRFNLAESGLFRVYLVSLSETSHRLLFSCHHAIIDGWSSLLLMNKVHELYLDLMAGNEIKVREDFSYQQAQSFIQYNSEPNQQYWDRHLAEIPLQNRLSDLVSVEHKEVQDLKAYKYVSQPAIEHHTYDAQACANIRTFCIEHGITINALFEFLCHQIINIYSFEQKTVTGATISGRDLPISGIEDSVGLLINTLPLVVDHQQIQNMSVKDALQQLQQQINYLNSNSSTYLASLQKEGRRIFDILFVHNNFSSLNNEAQFSQLKIGNLTTIEKLDYPLAMIVEEYQSEVQVALRYAGELFDASLMTGFFTVMDKILSQLIQSPSLLVREIAYVTPESCEVKKSSSTYSIVDIFEQCAQNKPQHIALQLESQSLSYEALNNRANQLARYLQARYSPAPETIVPICLHDPIEEIIAILAVLKLGCAYVPMGFESNGSQIGFTLKDVSASWVICQSTRAEQYLPYLSAEQLVCYDLLSKTEELKKGTQANLGVKIKDSSLCCVMYTSGSTGTPKGVLIQHSGVVSLTRDADYINIQADDVFVYLADRRFDASLFEIWGALLNACKLVLVADRLELFSNVNKLHKLITTQQISVVWLTKSLFDELLHQDATLFKSLHYLLVGGEALNRTLLEKLLRSDFAPQHLLNGYGPTENTTFSTVCELTLDKLNQYRAVPIGKSLSHRHAIVMSHTGQTLPIGAIGELYVGGTGLSRGYLNNESLTAAKFVKGNRGERLYKTGDLVTRSPQGEIVFVGRADSQIKLRGYRIELGEVEHALMAFNGIEQAVAAIKQNSNGHKQLVGYYSSEKDINQSELLTFITERCPDYMVPTFLVAMDAMPHTSSGKVDRNKLPDPFEVVIEQTHQTALSETQRKLVDIWSKVLGIDSQTLHSSSDFFAIGGDSILCLQMIGQVNKEFKSKVAVSRVFKNKTLAALANFIDNQVPDSYTKMRAIWADVLGMNAADIAYDSDFFSIGGDSILCLQMINKVNKELQQNIPLRIVFKHKTIALLCNYVEKAEQSKLETPTQQPDSKLAEPLPLLPIQQWFFDLNVKREAHFNQSFLIHTPNLDVELLEKCFEALVSQHRIFSVGYQRTTNNIIEQRYLQAPRRPNIELIDVSTLSAETLQDKLTALQSNFDIAQGPLFNVAYLDGYDDGSARIFMAFHHLIVDAVSWRIILADFETLYSGESLAPASSTFANWTSAVINYGKEHQQEKAFWQTMTADINRDIFKDQLLENNKVHRVSFSLERDLTSELLQNTNQAFNTNINDILLSALGLALKDVTQHNVHHLVLEGHGREQVNDNVDVSRTVGWFTTLSPIRIAVAEQLSDTIKATKETLHRVPNKGLGYGALFGYAPDEMPSISFNYLGQFNEAANNGWYLADEPAGTNYHQDNINHNIIDINCYVKGGQFVVDTDSKLQLDTAQGLQDAFARHLKEVIRLCVAQQITEYTPSDFMSIRSSSDIDLLPTIREGAPHSWFEMTEIQKAYLLGRLGSFEIGNISNHIYYEHVFEQLDVEELQKALRRLIETEPVLRTIYSFELMKQRMLSMQEFGEYQLAVNDHHDVESQGSELHSIRARLSHQVYDPEVAPLFTFEVSIFKDVSYLHLSMDLILLDAESRRRLLGKLDMLYREPHAPLPEKVTSFKRYQGAYQALRQSPWYESDKQYWQEKLTTMPLRPELPLKVNPNEVSQPVFADHTLYVEPETWQKFKQKAQLHDVSPSAALLSLYGEVIGFHAGSSEFIMTMTVFNRYPLFDDVEQIMGDFTSTNLFHFSSRTKGLVETIKRTHNVMWDNIAHSLYTGLEVQRDLVQLRDLDIYKATSPIVFTGVLGNKNEKHDTRKFLDDSELKARRLWMGQTSQAWIDLQAIEVGDRFMSKWLYVDQLFDQDYIDTLNRSYCAIIEYLADNDWCEEITDLLRVSKQQQAVLEQTNYQPKETSNRLLCDLIPASDEVAVIEGDGTAFTYRELHTSTHNLTHLIAHRKPCSVHSGELMAVWCEKGMTQVISTLAIMKSGHAYLPLNVSWPIARMLTVLEEGNVTHILMSRAQYELHRHLKALQTYQILVVEDLLDEIKQDQSFIEAISDNVLPEITANDIAYVIFTSGSTGTPKGVVISHQGAINTIDAVIDRLAMTASDKILALSDLSFDLSVFDIFGTLAIGGTIIFPEQENVRDIASWRNLIEQYGVTLWNSVPQLAGLLFEEYHLNDIDNHSLRAFLLSGDKIPITLPKQLKAQFPQADILSLGGATEGSIWSIWHDITQTDPSWNTIPYGTAMPNQAMLVLNDLGQYCPFNVIGEIHIAGEGVALGYWHDEEKTQASFYQHPTLGRLYKTGDLGRLLENGSIEFVGRVDTQVKINGYRVEMGDVESAIQQLDGAEEVVVHVNRKDSSNTLLAFIKPSESLTFADEKLAFKLAQHGDQVTLSNNATKFELLQPESEFGNAQHYERKSYRVFDGPRVDKIQLESALQTLLSEDQVTVNKVPDFNSLSHYLYALSAVSADLNGLPKYRYPSAGTLYPIQVYLRINSDELSPLVPGEYYYDRRQHQLIKVAENTQASDETAVEVFLVKSLSAIEPIYGAASDFLSTLECGYIEGLLQRVRFQNESDTECALFYQRVISDKPLQVALQAEQHVVTQLNFKSAADATQKAPPHDFYLYVKHDEISGLSEGWYQLVDNKLVALDWLPLTEIDALDDNATIWNNAGFAVFFVSEGAQVTTAQYLDVGSCSQQLMEVLLEQSIGCCALGEVHKQHKAQLAEIFGESKVIHHLVAGSISDTAKSDKATSVINQITKLNTYFRNKITAQLPTYMMPEQLIFVEEFPLSANGKVDRKSLLEELESSDLSHREIVVPTNELEIKLVNLWGEILKVDVSTISIFDSFFRLGGNSLLAMQFISNVKKLFDFTLNLDEFYKKPDIAAISLMIGDESKEVEREVGEL
ncbi:hypothetical protein PCIT_a3397 [Pseudoalteromonas citrea]|uniref:Carrier domain-containing protein n=2 Tax=Pseudoalteromonas citrea TaxID=43655 RepID=A0AAD4AGX9_9GAMM|nr:non-ribosomal peptide synthetase [Pseudoalteromonas citrea]KAF7768878.1 hypothetical protein PCIT_a3397 [Pseudoalteromonas citrea]